MTFLPSSMQLSITSSRASSFAVVVADESARDLREAQKLGQHVARGDFAVHELGEAVLFDAVVDLLGVLLQLDRSHFLHEFRQINRFVDADPVCDGMRLFDQLCQMLVPDDLVILESAEDGVVGAEAVEAAAEDAFVQKLVLAEKVQRAVGDRRTRKDQVVAADLAEPVQRLRALRLRVLILLLSSHTIMSGCQRVSSASSRQQLS